MRSQVALARFLTMSSGVHPISRSSFTSWLCQAASVISAPGICTDPIPSGSCAVNVNAPDRLGSRMMKPVSRSEPIKFSTRGSISAMGVSLVGVVVAFGGESYEERADSSGFHDGPLNIRQQDEEFGVFGERTAHAAGRVGVVPEPVADVAGVFGDRQDGRVVRVGVRVVGGGVEVSEQRFVVRVFVQGCSGSKLMPSGRYFAPSSAPV